MSDTTSDSEHGYTLRNAAVQISNVTTKEEYIRRKKFSCPKIEKKRRSQSVQVIRHKAHPVGLKGHLSPQYNPNINETYLYQRFLRVNKLGEGSYGAVYSVISKDDKKMYAVKIVKRYRPPNLLAEIEILDQIDGIVHCMGYVNAWMENNVLFIQLELAAASLHTYSYKNMYIEEKELFQILIDILFALKGMHGIGLLHMDIKPDNILQRLTGRYMLCDFGLSIFYDQKTHPYKPSEGDSKYLSCDMLRGEISPAGDIFALGITLFEVGHGIVLPEYGSDWHAFRKGKKIVLPENVRSLSPELSSIISWMMKKDPAQRPSADALLKHPTIQKHMAYVKSAEDILQWKQLTWLDERTFSHYINNQPLDRNLTKYTASMGQLGEFATNGGRKSWGWTFPDNIENSGNEGESTAINHKTIISNINLEVDDIFSCSNHTPETVVPTSSANNRAEEPTTQVISKKDLYKIVPMVDLTSDSSRVISIASRTASNSFNNSPARSVADSSNVKTPSNTNSLVNMQDDFYEHSLTKNEVRNSPNTSQDSPTTPEKRRKILEDVDEFFSERMNALSPITTEAIIVTLKSKCPNRVPSAHSTSPKTPVKKLLEDVRKRRVVRQLILGDEPIRTPKSVPPGSFFSLNFDNEFGNEEDDEHRLNMDN